MRGAASAPALDALGARLGSGRNRSDDYANARGVGRCRDYIAQSDKQSGQSRERSHSRLPVYDSNEKPSRPASLKERRRLPAFCICFLVRAAGVYLSAMGRIPQPIPGLIRTKEKYHTLRPGRLVTKDNLRQLDMKDAPQARPAVHLDMRA